MTLACTYLLAQFFLCSLVDEQVSGNLRICYYDCGAVFSVPVHRNCPLSLRHAYPVASHAYLPLYLCNLSGCLPQGKVPY